jgi:hypothetical protein
MAAGVVGGRANYATVPLLPTDATSNANSGESQFDARWSLPGCITSPLPIYL